MTRLGFSDCPCAHPQQSTDSKQEPGDFTNTELRTHPPTQPSVPISLQSGGVESAFLSSESGKTSDSGMHALSGFRDSLIYPEEISRVVAQAYNLALRRQKMGGSQTGSQLGYVARSCEERKEGRLAWADRSVSS